MQQYSRLLILTVDVNNGGETIWRRASLWQPHKETAGVRSVHSPFFFFGFLAFAVIQDVTSGTCSLMFECVQTVRRASSQVLVKRTHSKQLEPWHLKKVSGCKICLHSEVERVADWLCVSTTDQCKYSTWERICKGTCTWTAHHPLLLYSLFPVWTLRFL